jgi:hypothetical protein
MCVSSRQRYRYALPYCTFTCAGVLSDEKQSSRQPWVHVTGPPSMLEPVRPGAVSPDRALCLPTFSHFLIVNKTSLSPPPVQQHGCQVSDIVLKSPSQRGQCFCPTCDLPGSNGVFLYRHSYFHRRSYTLLIITGFIALQITGMVVRARDTLSQL